MPAAGFLPRRGRFCRFHPGHLRRHGLGPRAQRPEGICAVPNQADGWLDFQHRCAQCLEPISSAVRNVSRRAHAYVLFPPAPRAIPSWSCTTAATLLAHVLTAALAQRAKRRGAFTSPSRIPDGAKPSGAYYGQWIMEACVFTYDFGPLRCQRDLGALSASTRSHALLPAHHVSRDMFEDVDS